MTTEQELELIEKKKNGMKIKDLMEEYSIKSVKTIYDIIKRKGIKKLGNKKYSVNDSYFSKIDTEDKAYWLGFLYADGYVRMKYNRSGELKLKLSSKDKGHIKLFNESLESTYPIKDTDNKTKAGNISKVSQVSIYNTKLVNDLIKNGCVNNKTFKIEFPNINEKLYRHFIRGYFDGDGCISISKKGHFTIKIIGNEKFIKKMKEHLSKNGFNKIYVRKNGNVKNLFIYNIEDTLKFKDYIYNNSNISLKRKKSIFP